MRGKKAKAIRRAVEEQFGVGVLPLTEREYHLGTKPPFKGMIINSPGTGRYLTQAFKSAYKEQS